MSNSGNYPEPQSAAASYGSPSKEERQWAMVAHLAALLGFLIPFFHVIGPLLIWIMKRKEMPFVDDQAKEALNFQITISIFMLISAILIIVAVGFFLILVVCIYSFVLMVVAAAKANSGVAYRYPFTFRLIK